MEYMLTASLIRQCRILQPQVLFESETGTLPDNVKRDAKGFVQGVHSAFRLARCAVGVVIKNAPNLFHQEIRGERLL